MSRENLPQAGMVRFVLVGKREGFSGYLGGGGASRHRFAFSKGVCALPFQEAEQSRKMLRFFSAFPDGSRELAAAQESWRLQNGDSKTSTTASEVRPDGESPDQRSAAQSDGYSETSQGDTRSIPKGDGQERSPRAMKLSEAVKLLNPTKDDHWTSDGKPKLVLLQQLLKDNTLKREEVDQLGVTRETAAA